MWGICMELFQPSVFNIIKIKRSSVENQPFHAQQRWNQAKYIGVFRPIALSKIEVYRQRYIDDAFISAARLAI